MSEQRSWLPLVAVIIMAGATVALLYWAVHRAGAAPLVQFYKETMSEETLRERCRDQQFITRGRTLFLNNCTLCHGTEGQGLIGPNLRDEFWLHGSDLQKISESIANGNPNRGMAAWKPVFSSDDLHAVVAYLVSLQGRENGSGKPPEGVKSPMLWLKDAP